MNDFIRKFGGRKFVLAAAAMALGFIVAIFALNLVVKHPAAAMHVSEIVGQFAILLSVAIGAFNGANAVVEWRHGAAGVGAASVAGMQRSETVSATVSETRQRQIVNDPDGDHEVTR